MCRAIGEGGRRCICAGTQLVRHNERRRENRAIRRNVAEWARQHGHSPEECAQLAAAPPKVAKDWIKDKGYNPQDFVAGVPSGAPKSWTLAGESGQEQGAPPHRGAIPDPPAAGPAGGGDGRPGGTPAPVGGAAPVGGGGGRAGSPAAAGPGHLGGPVPRWSTGTWCTGELRGQIQAVMDQQGGHRDERSLLSGSPEKSSRLTNQKAANGAKSGVNTTYRVELDNGVVGYFKPFGGEDKRLERSFGQDSSQQSLHEAAAWRLASQMGPPWSDMVPPVVIREMNGEVGSFALEKPGKSRDRDPWRSPEWREGAFFDCLIGNQDRHGGNYVIAGDRLSLIDHGYAFAEPGDRQNVSRLVWNRVYEDAALTYQEREVLQRLVSSPDLMGMEKVLQPGRAQALRARAEGMLADGVVKDTY